MVVCFNRFETNKYRPLALIVFVNKDVEKNPLNSGIDYAFLIFLRVFGAIVVYSRCLLPAAFF